MLEIKDKNLCAATAENLKVIQPESRLILTYEKTDIDCYDNNTGSITLSATGGWEPYIFGQNGNVSATNILDGLNYNSQGYNVFVRDDEGVEESINVMLEQPEKLIATINTTHHLKCFEDNSGAVKLNISGGIQPYTLSENQTEWFSGDSLGGFSAGTKTIYFADKNICKGSLSATLNQPSKLTIKTEQLDFPECGKNNGTITVSAQGGTNTNGYLYSWQNLNLDQFLTETSHHLSNIKSGKYLTTVFDNNQCKDAIEILLSDIDGPAINEIKIDSVSCNGKEDGSIHITNISGGFPQYEYFLNGNETLPLMENLRAGVYQVSVIDQHDCRLEKRYTVSEPTPIAIEPVMISPTCHDSNDGVIELNITGGNGGYIINWFDGKDTPTLTELTGGEYPLEVSDWKNCKTEEILNLATPNKPAPEWDGEKAVVCTGRTVTLYGGDFDNYKWYKDNDFISDLPDITIGESGIYKLEITDNVGCSGFGLYELGVSESPLDAVLLIADSALVNDAIKAVDVTWPIPDSINWLYSHPVSILDNNEWSELFSLDKEASLKVTLRAWYQGCFSDTSKTVIIFNNEFEDARIANTHMPLIEGFQAYPNPNQGQFSVKVKLSRKVSGSIELIEPKNYYVIHASTLNDQDKYELDFDLHNLSPGIYFLRFKAGNERQVLKLLIY